MKNNMALKMLEHIRNAKDVESWAVFYLEIVLSAYMAEGCVGCAYESTEEWLLPCCKCRRNSKDYWRAKDDTT